MLNSKGVRELAYLVTIDDIRPIPGKDRVECAVVGGWTIMVRKGVFKVGDPGIYFEIDSLLPEKEPFMFLKDKKFHIKTQKYKTPDGQFWSQGLLLHAADFGWTLTPQLNGVIDSQGKEHIIKTDSGFLTELLEVKHCENEDENEDEKSRQKSKVSTPDNAINFILKKHPNIARRWGKLIKNTPFLKKLFLFFFKNEKNFIKETKFPTQFPYVKKTDQERCENMPWVLKDKTPYIVTQKCDGSSSTFILARNKGIFKEPFEFFVCSRNKRILSSEQKHSHYWEAAIKYNIKDKMEAYLKEHRDIDYICWQGEICSPKIQSNPLGLTRLHLFLFHWIDSKKGKWDIREAVDAWKKYDLETVPIVSTNFILPDDFDELKAQAEGEYVPSVCEGKINQKREGFVYYKTTDPNFSFKNVSRSYLLKHHG